MTITRKVSDTGFKFLFFILCCLYIVLYMPFGFEGTDTGYIFGTSWNIYNGQIPHRDFIYTRPAIPAFFHTIFIYISETYGFILSRSFFYIQVFLYSFLGAKLITQHFSIKSETTLYFLAILGALFSIHNYPPMAWNTIDGVFFCMIGLYLILQQNANKWNLFFGAFFIVLSVFTKQSFYFMPIFLFIYLLISKDIFRLKYVSLFGIFFAIIYFGFKYFTDSILPFYEQTFVRATSSGLLDVGVKKYYLALKLNIFYLTGILIIVWLSRKYIQKKYIYLLINCAIASYMIYVFYNDAIKWTIIKYLFQLLFLVSIVFSVFMLRKDKRFLLLVLLLLLSWSASISNGYQTPIHFSIPMVASLYLMFFSYKSKTISLPIAGSIIFIYLGTFYLGYQTLYRDSTRNKLTYSMEKVFPQLKFIKSDKGTYEKFMELKKLSDAYKNFTVIPSMTLAHYLTNTINPIGIDWPLDVEINNESSKLIQQLLDKNTTVFMENSGFTKKELEGYEIKTYIENNWQLQEKTEYFTVYSSPQN